MKLLIYTALLSMMLLGCQKQDEWLDEKINKSEVVPKTLNDLQALLDYTQVMNNSMSTAGLAGSDNIYTRDVDLKSTSSLNRNLYLWEKDLFPIGSETDFIVSYYLVQRANTVLEVLGGITPQAQNQVQYNNVKGQALFFRAIAYYNLSSSFCSVYNEATAATDLGLQLRTSTDPNVMVPRSSVKDTYSFIINDLVAANELLGVSSLYKTRPNKVAASALLAKTYLVMEKYSDALVYAKNVLGSYDTLLNYNNDQIIATSTYRFPVYSNTGGNPEVIFYAAGVGNDLIWPYGVACVDSLLYKSYNDNDLRKSLYFSPASGGIKFAGSYTGSSLNFGGLATNEVYLIAAECYARGGDATNAMILLNKLVKERWNKNSVFVPYTASLPKDALLIILDERRRELPFTAQIRWEDLRRLNKNPEYAKTISRVFDGRTYTLLPGSLNYTFPLPVNEVRLSGVPQNVREQL